MGIDPVTGGALIMFGASMLEREEERRKVSHAADDLTTILSTQAANEPKMPGAADAAKVSASEQRKGLRRKGFRSTILTDPLGGGLPLTASPVLG